MDIHAILHTAVNAATLARTELPEPGPGELLIRTLFSCISPGTELRCLAGQQPGSLPWPYIPGYALTGEVIACGSDTSLPIGSLVFCGGTRAAGHPLMWGGHVSHAVQREHAVYPLPAGVDPREGALAKLAAIAYHGLRLSRPLPHEQVAAVGLGPLGQLSARLHRLAGARVVATDPVASRVALARAAGIDAHILEGGAGATLAPLLPGGADVVVDATGVPGVLPEILELARALPWDDTPTVGARYLLQGSYADAVPLPYQAAFARELQLLIPRDAQACDIRAALDLLADGRLAAGDLISLVASPSEANAVYAELRTNPERLLTAVFDWNRLG